MKGSVHSVLLSTVLGLVTPCTAQDQHLATSESLSGVWEITLTSRTDGTDSTQAGRTATFRMAWKEAGNAVFGTLEAGRWLGRRDGDRLSFTIHSLGASEKEVRRGGAQVSGTAELGRTGRGWVGSGVGMEPAAGNGAFETFGVSARKVSSAAPASVVGTDWCHLLDIDEILDDLFKETFFQPMDVCTASKDGGGFYLFGDEGPGSVDHPYATFTIYFPWESTAVCTQRTYGINLSSGSSITTIQGLIAALKLYTKFLSYLGVNASTLEAELLSWYSQYGEFALSVGTSKNTGFTTLYINTGVNARPGICSAIQNSSVVSAISRVFNYGSGFAVKCGSSIDDTYVLRRSVVPDPTLHCSTPIGFLYLFGTINVRYN